MQVPPVSCITDLDGELSVLGYVFLDYLSACGYIFLFTSAAGVNFPVSEYFNSTVYYMFFAFEVRKSPAFR